MNNHDRLIPNKEITMKDAQSQLAQLKNSVASFLDIGTFYSDDWSEAQIKMFDKITEEISRLKRDLNYCEKLLKLNSLNLI